jgi:hypothetical protein
MWIGAGAIEFILCHAEVEIAFVEEKKIEEVHFSSWTPASLIISYLYEEACFSKINNMSM